MDTTTVDQAAEIDTQPPFQCSRSIANIAVALAKAQGEIKNPTRDKTAEVTMKSGGKYTYNYADLATVLEAVRPALSKHEIALVQPPVMAGQNRLEVVTALIHSSGEWISSALGIDLGERTPQAVGGAITYLRRYQVQSLVGVASEEDDDAGTTDVKMAGRHDDRDRRHQHRQENAASTARVADKLRESHAADAGAQPTAPAEPTIPADNVYTPLQLKHVEKDAQGQPIVFGILTAELGDWMLETKDREVARALVDAKKAGRKVVIEWSTVNGRRTIDQISAPPAPANGAAA